MRLQKNGTINRLTARLRADDQKIDNRGPSILGTPKIGSEQKTDRRRPFANIVKNSKRNTKQKLDQTDSQREYNIVEIFELVNIDSAPKMQVVTGDLDIQGEIVEEIVNEYTGEIKFFFAVGEKIFVIKARIPKRSSSSVANAKKTTQLATVPFFNPKPSKYQIAEIIATGKIETICTELPLDLIDI